MRILLGILAVLLLGLQYRLWIGEGSVASIVQTQNLIAAQQDLNDQLQQRNSRLTSQVNELKKGLDSVEEQARSQLGMIKSDETFYLLVKH